MKCPSSDAARTMLRTHAVPGYPNSGSNQGPQRNGWLRRAAVDSIVPVIGRLKFRSQLLNSYLSHLLETGPSGNFPQCALPLPAAL